jgi:hypothetical protein
MREILQEAKRKHFLTRNVALDVTQIPETHKTRQSFTEQEIRLRQLQPVRKMLEERGKDDLNVH